MSLWRRNVTRAEIAAQVPVSGAPAQPSCSRPQRAAELRRNQWRRAAAEAERALRPRRDASPSDRGAAVVVYLASLEREEKAAGEYQAAWESARAHRV